jgi:hypothetical protein
MPITTQNTTNPRENKPWPERDLNLRYQQPSDLIPHGHRDRRLFIYCILNSFFLRTLNSSFVMDSFKLSAYIFDSNFYLLYCEVSWDFSINTVGNSEHDGSSYHHVSYLAHCLNLAVQVTQTLGRIAAELFVTSREVPDNSGIYFNKGISL